VAGGAETPAGWSGRGSGRQGCRSRGTEPRGSRLSPRRCPPALPAGRRQSPSPAQPPARLSHPLPLPRRVLAAIPPSRAENPGRGKQCTNERELPARGRNSIWAASSAAQQYFCPLPAQCYRVLRLCHAYTANIILMALFK